jgi:hypothetical protein
MRSVLFGVTLTVLTSSSAFAGESDVETDPTEAESSAETDPAPAPAAGRTPLTIADEGMAAHLAKDFARAQPLFEEAYSGLSLPSIGVWLARNLAKSGRLLDAQARYRAIAEEKKQTTAATFARARSQGLQPPGAKEQRKAKQDAAFELAALVARIPTLVVAIDGAPASEVSLSIDRGGSVPTGEPAQLEPGPIKVEGSWGAQRIVREVVIHERDRATIGLSFRAAPASEEGGAGRALAGWVLVGVGAGGAAIGAVLGGVALAKLGSLDCPENLCTPDQADDMDSYNALRLPAGFLIIGGGLLAATGGALLLTAPDSPDGDVALRLGPGFVGLTGSF